MKRVTEGVKRTWKQTYHWGMFWEDIDAKASKVMRKSWVQPFRKLRRWCPQTGLYVLVSRYSELKYLHVGINVYEITINPGLAQ